MFIKLSEYAKMHGKSISTVRERVEHGDIPAVRSGNRWYIDSETPYPTDERIKHGAYIGIRDKIKGDE